MSRGFYKMSEKNSTSDLRRARMLLAMAAHGIKFREAAKLMCISYQSARRAGSGARNPSEAAVRLLEFELGERKPGED